MRRLRPILVLLCVLASLFVPGIGSAVGDLNHDGVLSNEDRAFVGVALNSAEPTGEILMGDPGWTPEADLNFDGVIDDADLDIVSSLVDQGGVSEPGALWVQQDFFLRGLTIGYAGMPYDDLAGAWLMRNRWHSPTLGRFISRDPAGYIDGMSLYAYVSGNPLKYWDPFGLACEANWHHQLPQEFSEQFEKAGTNIDDKEFAWLLKRGDHQKLHNANWNDRWRQFFKKAADEGLEVTDADIRAKLTEFSGENKFKRILARGAEAPVASYSQWKRVADKDAAFKAAREATAGTVRRIGGKAGRVTGKAVKSVVRKLPVIAGVFFVADVVSGENAGVAAANAVLPVDVETVRGLGEAGQQYVNDVVDSRRSGFTHQRQLEYQRFGIADIIEQSRNEER